MEVLFLGVGEACDSQHGNSSALITTQGFNLLLDCGFSVPHRFFSYSDDPEGLDAVWVSHFHGDHFFGLPLLLLRFWEMGRTRPLQLIGQKGLEEKAKAALELAYPGFSQKLSFPLQFGTISLKSPLPVGPLMLEATQTIHSQCNYGLLLDDGQHRLYYSGDGRPTVEVQQLLKNCDLVIHEAFTLEDAIPNHGSVNGCLHLMKAAHIKQLALIHIERKTRRDEHTVIRRLLKTEPGLILVKEGDCIYLI